MDYEWDSRKAESNAAMLGVRFPDAVGVFTDEHALTIEDMGRGEERYVTVGMDVFYTWRGDTIRLVSARKATWLECAQYTQGEP